jgi:hypothetical protein
LFHCPSPAVACGREFTVITTMSRAACRVLEVALDAAEGEGAPVSDDLIGSVPDSVVLSNLKYGWASLPRCLVAVS